MHRVARVPVIRGVATVLLIMGINVLALLFLATFGLAAAPAVPHALKLIVAVAYAGLAVYVAAIIARPRWLASRPLFDVLLGAGLGGHARALLVRLPHIAVLFTFQIFMLHGFGVAVPILQAIAALPVVFFIAVLPISVQGLGTTQAAMIFFFARYAAGDSHAQQAAVLAASLVGQVCALTFQVVAGGRLPEEPRRPRRDGGGRRITSRPRTFRLISSRARAAGSAWRARRRRRS